jgi:hypothetical protein
MIGLLKNQIELIQGGIVRDLVLKALNNVNTKFWSAGASSTGKYHPDYSAGNQGLLRHTQSVVYFTSIFCKNLKISQYEKDCLIAAAILHDTCKSGLNWESEYTVHEHPLLAYRLLDVNTMNEIEARAWKDINNIIATHMGQWTTSNHSQNVLPKIVNKAQMVMHWADYLGSRKAINVNHYNLAIPIPEFPEWKGLNSEIFSEEIALIKDNDIKNLILKAIDKELYSGLNEIIVKGNVPEWYKKEGGLINKIKTSIFVAQQLLNLEKTFVDEADKDIIYATLFFKEMNEAYNADELEGAELLYYYQIRGIITTDNNSWEKMIINVCEDIANDSTLEINFLKEEAKDFRPATEKQVYRLKLLIEEIQKLESYDGKYDKIKPEKLSIGMAGKYISELKEIIN